MAMMTQFVMPLFLTRFLTKTDYGIYSQFYLLLTFLGGILTFGMQSNLYYFFPKYDEKKSGNLVWNNVFLMCLLGMAGCLIVSIPFVKDMLLGESKLADYYNIVLICILLFIPTNMLAPLAVVRKDKWLAVLYPPADIMLKMFLVISAALSFSSLSSIFYAILLLEIIEVVFVFSYIYTRYKEQFIIKEMFNKNMICEQLAYSIPFGVAVILNTICQRFDKIICVSSLSAEDYAIYSVAFFGIPGIMQVYDSICQVNVTNMSCSAKNGDYKGIIPLYRRFVVQTLSFSVPVIFIVMIFSSQIVELFFTDKYAASVPFFRLYIATFIIAMIGAGTILRALGKTKKSMHAFLISTIVYIPLAVVLVKFYGLWGAMCCAIIGSVLPRIIQVVFELRILKVSIAELFPLKDILLIVSIGVIAALPVLYLNSTYNLNIYWTLLLSIVYIVAVYAVEISANVFILDGKYAKNKVKAFFHVK